MANTIKIQKQSFPLNLAAGPNNSYPIDSQMPIIYINNFINNEFEETAEVAIISQPPIAPNIAITWDGALYISGYYDGKLQWAKKDMQMYGRAVQDDMGYWITKSWDYPWETETPEYSTTPPIETESPEYSTTPPIEWTTPEMSTESMGTESLEWSEEYSTTPPIEWTTPEMGTESMETESMETEWSGETTTPNIGIPLSVDDILNDNSISSLSKTINDYING